MFYAGSGHTGYRHGIRPEKKGLRGAEMGLLTEREAKDLDDAYPLRAADGSSGWSAHCRCELQCNENSPLLGSVKTGDHVYLVDRVIPCSQRISNGICSLNQGPTDWLFL
jgi:hypothetical protein